MTVSEILQHYRELADKIDPSDLTDKAAELGYHILNDNGALGEGSSLFVFLNKDIDNVAALRVIPEACTVEVLRFKEKDRALAHFLDVTRTPNMHCGDEILRAAVTA